MAEMARPMSIPLTNRFRAARSYAQKSRVGLPLGLINRLDLTGRLYLDSDKAQHDYLTHYRRHLGPLRYRANTLLEIGVGGYDSRTPGGSLRIWRDSLPFSRIIGVDLHDKQVDLGRRVHFMRIDQGNTADLTRLVDCFGVPNIVIDDGSHVGEHINTSFRMLFPLMPSGSIYVIEDLHTSYWPSFGGSVPTNSGTAVGLLRLLLDDIQSNDTTFDQSPNENRPDRVFSDVKSACIYPGIAFIGKR